ncbi:MAG: MerR family transcriptional regulator [bacterium]
MQQQKMNMSEKKLRIGDLAKALKVQRYVIRFWEKEFALTSDRSQGGQRFYTTTDLELFSKIKTLLYDQGFTISGAKKQIKSKNKSDKTILAATKEQDTGPAFDVQKQDEFMLKIKSFKEELLKLERLL